MQSMLIKTHSVNDLAYCLSQINIVNKVLFSSNINLQAVQVP